MCENQGGCEQKMRNYILVLLFIILFASNAYSQTVWHPANQLTVTWDAVTADVDGDPLPIDFDLRYKLVVASAKSDPNHESPIEIADIPAPTLTAVLTLPSKGQWFVGIKAVLIGVDLEFESAINWAHELEGQDGELWAAIHIANPNFPRNLENP